MSLARFLAISSHSFLPLDFGDSAYSVTPSDNEEEFSNADHFNPVK
jgi:hypothetical protein